MLLMQFITVVEVFVIVNGAISSAQTLSAKLGDDSCLVVLLGR